MQIACLLPATGASARMRGGDKLLEAVEGAPCLAVMAQRALRAGMEVFVTLPSADHPRAQILAGMNVNRVYVPNAAQGMSASLRAGARAMPNHIDAMMVLPPDMPELQSPDFSAMIETFASSSNAIIQATTQTGAPGHPVLFPADLLPLFNELTGDIGAATLLKAQDKRVHYLPLSGERARLDLDTPEDWQAWRSSL